MARYLTKSRFKLALECPTKLYYTDKPDLYENQKKEDAFLQALAEYSAHIGCNTSLPGTGWHSYRDRFSQPVVAWKDNKE
ncbi:MAG: hypothetical protein EOM06_07625 [Sphingobacteriia bacterium]|nr:hypothetical protein [Sphingobacteriia bacterium]